MAEQFAEIERQGVAAQDTAVRCLLSKLDDDELFVYIRAGQRYVSHVPAGAARDRVNRRLAVAREERRQRAARRAEPRRETPTPDPLRLVGGSL